MGSQANFQTILKFTMFSVRLVASLLDFSPISIACTLQINIQNFLCIMGLTLTICLFSFIYCMLYKPKNDKDSKM